MAINKNHEFEDLNGVKCAIVEKNASTERVAFLKPLLELNRYTVVVVASPPPKPALAPPKPQGATEAIQPTVEVPPPPSPETFTIGVTDVGRLLHTIDGHVVTLAYWKQQETTSHDEVPYYENKQ